MAEQFDVIVRGGRVVGCTDAAWGSTADVGIRGGQVAAVGDLTGADAREEVDARGLYVGPGWIDLHAHVWGESLGVHPDRVAGVDRGVTTVVDAGSFGSAQVEDFLAGAVRPSQTRVLGFVNISLDTGQSPVHGDYRNFDLDTTVAALMRYGGPDGPLVGVKVMASQSHCGMLGAEPVRLAVEAAELAGTRVMSHIGHAPPTLPEVLAILQVLGPRAVVTHAWHGKAGGLLDAAGTVRSSVHAAMEAGVRWDLGHGSASFAFATARAAMAAGLALQSLSTDLHRGNVAGPVHDLATTMTKFLALGSGLREVLEGVTVGPARLIGREDRLGTLAVGREADLTLFAVEHQETVLTDSEGETLASPERIVPAYALRAGRVLRCRPPA